MLAVIIIVVIASIGFISIVSTPQPEDTPEDILDLKITDLMSENHIPSLAVGIVINDTLEWSNGYGNQSDLDTVYMIGSLTKLFAATAIMQLNETGMLDLDTDINNYLPFNVRNPSYPNDSITTRMLLTHSSGLCCGVYDEILWDYDADMIDWQNDRMGWNITQWSSRPTLGEFINGSLNPSGAYYSEENWCARPDTQRQYSNTGFLLLSYMLEEITNQKYEDYLQENVLDPLDMNSTGFDYADFLGRNAIPYERRHNTNDEYPLYNQYNFGGGGLRSTVPDLANFLIAHTNRGNYRGKQILQPETIELMQKVDYSFHGTELGGLRFRGQGLGWPIYRDDLFGHSGAILGYLSQVILKSEDDEKFGIVILVNRGITLVPDVQDLLDTFFPKMVDLLFNETDRLLQLNSSNEYLVENSFGSYLQLFVNCQQWIKKLLYNN
jgi:CubicO group peptidase (beta-lactamase class C family)